MFELKLKRLEDTLDEYDLLLFDLWGVIVEGSFTYPGVVEAINEIIKTKKVNFVTNAPRPNFCIVDTLRSWGLKNITPEMITSSGDMARQLINERYNKNQTGIPRIFHLGSDKNDDILKQLDHQIVNNIEEADIFLLSLYRDEPEDINEFNELLQQVANKPNLVKLCANPDTTISQRGIIRYCAGHFANIIEDFGSKVTNTGKPEKMIYDKVFEQNQDIVKDRILMIGDTFETDILGANRSGIHSALVLTGNSNKIHQNYHSIQDKLGALSLHSEKVDMKPTFVTQIV